MGDQCRCQCQCQCQILILAGVHILIERMLLQHHVLDINQLSVFVEQSKQ